jgi:hypothetical protein
MNESCKRVSNTPKMNRALSLLREAEKHPIEKSVNDCVDCWLGAEKLNSRPRCLAAARDPPAKLSASYFVVPGLRP